MYQKRIDSDDDITDQMEKACFIEITEEENYERWKDGNS